MALAANTGASDAQPARATLKQVLVRLTAYIDEYPRALGRIVAEERYEQWVEPVSRATTAIPAPRSDVRITRADLGFAQLGREWAAIRDVFEVDGVPVQDAAGRLERALARPDAGDSLRTILRDNARFNVDAERVGRNINVPTMAVQFLQERHRWRFSFSRDGEESIDGRPVWRIRFRERVRPTLVRQVGGRDQPLRGVAWVDPLTGEVFKTDLTWERGPGGHILVTYGRVAGIVALVPLTMSEQYTDERGGTTSIRAEARYSNFRQFTTRGRLLTP